MNSKYMKAILEGNAEELSRLRRKCGLDATPANIIQDEELRTNIPQSLLTHPTSFCKTYKHHGLVRHSYSDVLQSIFSHHKGSFKRSLVYNTGSRRTTPMSLEDENVEIPSKYVCLLQMRYITSVSYRQKQWLMQMPWVMYFVAADVNRRVVRCSLGREYEERMSIRL